MRRLLSYVAPERRLFLGSASASITNKVLDLMPPVLVAWVIDTVRGVPPAWISTLVGAGDAFSQAAFLAVLGVGIFALESLFQWMYQAGFRNLAQRVQHTLRLDAYDRMQSREIEFFETHRTGETMAVLGDDINQLERFLNTGFNEILQLAVLFVFAGVVLFQTSWQLACIGLAPVPVILWGSLLYQRRISPRYTRVRSAVGELAGRLENNIGGIMVIKSFTAEKFESARVRAASEEYRAANTAAIHLSSMYVPIIRIAVAFGFGGVLLVGSYWILQDRGILTVGQLVLFSMLIQRVLWPLTRLGTTLDELERARAAARRAFGLLDTEPRIRDGADARALELPVRGAVCFQDVHFAYPEPGPGGDASPAKAAVRPVLQGLNLTIAPGQTVGLAGTTGAGKSTLIKLLLRLYDPTGGTVSIDGQDLRGLYLQALRENIALVSQDVYLFHGTIAENIAYSRLDSVTPDEIRAAARQAELDEFVSSLPNGYETVVGERGIRLSGGQRQRLSIARAVIKDAPVMIFDEATSSVDTETERAIQRNLLRLTRGRTALVIAHRLSTIRNADRIVVLEQGRIAEDGTHAELSALGGIYSDLWRVQAGEAGEVEAEAHS